MEAKQSTSVDQKQQQQHQPENQCDDVDGVVKKLDVLKNCRRSGEEKSVESCKSGLVVSQLRKEVNTYRSCSHTAAKFAGDQEKNLPKVVQQQQEKQERAYSVTEKLFIPISAISPRPESATQKIFVPRTEDMNKGFLMFSEEEPGLTSKFICIILIFCNFS